MINIYKLVYSVFYCLLHAMYYNNVPDRVTPKIFFEHSYQLQIKKLVEDLNLQCKDSHVVGIGQSPAYIIELAQCLRNQKSKTTYTIAPFSGGIKRGTIPCYGFSPGLRAKQGRYDELLSYEKNFYETEKYKNFYKKVLQPSKITVDDIISRYKNEKKSTVFVDVVESASSLGSFICLLLGAAKKQGYLPDNFLKAIKIYFYKWNGVYSHSIKLHNISVVGSQTFDNDSKLADIMRGFNADDKLRLVCKYPEEQWIEKDPTNYVPHPCAHRLLKYLKSTMQDHQCSEF